MLAKLARAVRISIIGGSHKAPPACGLRWLSGLYQQNFLQNVPYVYRVQRMDSPNVLFIVSLSACNIRFYADLAKSAVVWFLLTR